MGTPICTIVMLKKKRNTNVDRISLLPDSLIHIIMSFLPIQQVVQTCVLSKRWKIVWTRIPKIKLHFHSYLGPLAFTNPSILNFQSKAASFKHLILGVLSQHCGTNIQTLSYSSSDADCEDKFFVEFLVFYARCHMVQKLCLVFPNIESFDWRFCLSGFKTLTELKLTFGFVDDWGSLMLPSLRILKIDCGYEDKNYVGSIFHENMFSGCPNLESLALHDYPCQSFGICAPKLKDLKLCSTSELELHFIVHLRLSTPNLQCVEFTNVLAMVESASNFPYLDKVILEVEDQFEVNPLEHKPKLLEYVLKFLQAFHNARSLTLPSDILKVLLSYGALNGCLSFRNLINLKLKTKKTNEMIDLPVGLSPCVPFLNTLVVDLHH